MTDVETVPSPADQHPTTEQGTEWWRSAVIYQIYPRSFADADGDGIGDLAGIEQRLPALRELGADAIWLSPFYTSPQKDAGYDVADYCDVDPLFGTLADFDALLARAHNLGLRVIVDLVPNHSSSQHRWFQEALAAGPGSTERARYIFRDEPNNWESVFGGSAWTRVPDGQYYLHLFDESQPDLDWTNPWVREQFRGILRFWLDRGVDGFRVDVAHGLVKKEGLPDYAPSADSGSMGGDQGDVPYWAQPGVHEIYREWHALLAEYEGDRVLCAEAWVEPLSELALWVRPDEMQQAFNFSYLECPWSATALRRTIETSIRAFAAVGAPSTWVLSNHDVVRHATRLALTVDNPQGTGLGPDSPGIAPYAVGIRRARAATALMLALPGSAYIYQGEELGLPEVIDLPPECRQDPTWSRTGHEKYGRDGCRVPIPWEAAKPSYGFGPTEASWLPQPEQWASLARDRQAGVPGSTLELYRTLLVLRATHALGTSALEWDTGYGPDVVAIRVGDVTVIANAGSVPVELPSKGSIIVASADVVGGTLEPDTTVWIAPGR